MKPISIGLNLRMWFAALCGLVLVSCGGGGGDSGATSPGNSLTPASTRAAISELGNAFAATLTGAQEVPQRSSSATGSGTVVILTSTRLMTATLTTSGIDGTSAHIQQAQAGTNGPIVFPLTETVRGSGIWTTRATLTEAQYNAFRAGDFYFNVNSSNFANGEIRGQILSQQPGTTPASVPLTSTNQATGTGTASLGTRLNPFVTSTTTFLAALRGSHEVPPLASNALGSGSLLLNPVNRQMTAAVTTSGIVGTSAHIHEAAPGTSGPIIIPLTELPTGSGIWTANALLTEAQFNALQAGNLYFNVHSTAFPNGEIRGQILPQTISLEFVTGAADRTGTGTTDTSITAPPGGMTGTGNTSPGLTGTGTTGTGTTGSGLTGTGLTGTGLTGTGTGMMSGTDNTAGFAR